jgi:hypothetical protein
MLFKKILPLKKISNMKKIRHIFIVLVVLICSLTLQAQPQIKFESVVYDFGIFNEEDGVQKAVFNFTNTGSEPLKLITVRAS